MQDLMRRLRWRGFKWRAIALLALGRRDAALQVFQDMLAEFPGDAYPLASIAHLQGQGGATDAALATMARLLKLHPGDGAHWFNQGFLLEAAGRYGEAETAFRRAVELRPALDRAWYGLGLCLIRLGRLDEAVDALKRNTQLQPMSPYGWYQLARVHADRHEAEEARRIIRHLQRFEPKVAAQLVRETGLLVSSAS
ncbi:tetratricopeptide repeat protein [Ramlibacter tataouinensis]|uniref:tetratricopeptide repeat protein n=1 Tax=Ramlibacter tataouinensis TaxID=94132 RepID=UPI0022F390C8|nr:tetratricopeptide repeat protein [Ramlibacter tataouinensis]WBY01691.1 tetratricopeptide repeat protein [Ramlibacter tataouinensis]